MAIEYVNCFPLFLSSNFKKVTRYYPNVTRSELAGRSDLLEFSLGKSVWTPSLASVTSVFLFRIYRVTPSPQIIMVTSVTISSETNLEAS